ncbi:uncharacterized protein MELLADRAFT_109042 [Melampsora larici-populina 98AG31]|uniref:Uncharacterized protein n=1 Tax=Melampsora larici-populina (strain 98AG31 / pathotype 3-4-7) TaxID=747676 RepID=F4RV51_MELLP|nr:uncharacterized protein MELLADRAFT_109042 [Melampsora larici-populina 98AG31]EGG03726.1 hypothetical protein MELLADRAFT_109042 [Melampsora larici-populina 98AG31]
MSLTNPEDINLHLPTLLKVPNYLTLWNFIKSNEGIQLIQKIINLLETTVKAKLISARVYQPNQLVYINQSSSGPFGYHDWKVLGSKLSQWSDLIDNLIEVVGQSLNHVKLVGVTV